MNILMAGRSSPTQLSRQSESDRPERTKELPAKGTDAARDCENTRCVLQSPVQRKDQEMNDPAVVEGIGFAAAGLVLTTFYMRSMIALRWVAIASNLAFIAYGYLDNLPPVLLLHLLLLPLNIFRLAQLRQQRIGAAPHDRHGLASDLPERRCATTASAEIRQPSHEQSALNESTRARPCRKPWLALVLHVSRITPGK